MNNLCKHDWTYIDAVGVWMDDYWVVTDEYYWCPKCKKYYTLHIYDIPSEDKEEIYYD